MNDQRAQFIELLQSDNQLLRMLGTNKAFWNEDLPAEARYSILPVDKVTNGMNPCLLTIQVSNENLIGTKLTDAFIYVRCYNSTDKTFVNIDKVLSRVKALLHNHRFRQYADNAVSIDTVYESTGSELRDEAYGLNYRESRYRLLYL
jgi:hypothetical protein